MSAGALYCLIPGPQDKWTVREVGYATAVQNSERTTMNLGSITSSNPFLSNFSGPADLLRRQHITWKSVTQISHHIVHQIHAKQAASKPAYQILEHFVEIDASRCAIVPLESEAVSNELD